MATKRLQVHRLIYILLLTLLAGSAVTSKFMMNLAWTLLFANWVVEWDMKRKFADFPRNGLLHFAILLFLLPLVGLIWCDNLTSGLGVVRQSLPLIAIPLVVLTSQPLTKNQWRIVAVGYIGTLTVVTVIGIIRWLTLPDLPYRKIVPYISHIRFSLNLVLAICIMFGAVLTQATRPHSGWRATAKTALCVLLTIWFLFFLVLIQSYTGLIILLATAIVAMLFGQKKIANRRLRLGLICTLLVATAALTATCACYVHEYYSPRLAHVDTSPTTQGGRPYTFANDGLLECGRMVNDYVCEEELRSQWQRVSRMPYDTVTPVGYPVGSALVRYLNAMGVTKDSAGVMCLRRDDIEAIEHGIANPIYRQKASLRHMVYVMLFEYENYRCFRNVRGFTMLQRIELWKAAWSVACDNWVHGVGTGDLLVSLDAKLQAHSSPLAGSKMYPHNQYLTLLASYGFIAFALLCAGAVWAFVRNRLWRNTLWMACITIVLVSCHTEDTIATGAGAIFSALFTSLTSKIAETNA